MPKTRQSRRASSAKIASHAAVPPVPGRAALDALCAQVRALPNVVSCYLGHKTSSKGVVATTTLVCVVSRKLKESALSKKDRIPPTVSVALKGDLKLTLPTDVVVDEVFQRATVSPGDAVSNPAPGTIGVALLHPRFGEVVTTAGHVYFNYPLTHEWNSADAPVVPLLDAASGAVVQGRLAKVVINDTADYALIKPIDRDCRNVYDSRGPNHGALILGGPYHPDANDAGEPCAVLAARAMRFSSLVGVDRPVDFPDGTTLKHAIVTDRCTFGGDSGACLINRSRKIMGLLVGFSGQLSAFMPIERLLCNEHSEVL